MNPTAMPPPSMADAAPPPGPPPAMPSELCVPLASLAQPDDQEQNVTPQPGDKGSANIDYSVLRVEGDQAYITIEGVNGEKIGAAAAGDDAGEPSEQDEETALRQQLGGTGAGGYQ
jgi:hypothetical protein